METKFPIKLSAVYLPLNKREINIKITVFQILIKNQAIHLELIDRYLGYSKLV